MKILITFLIVLSSQAYSKEECMSYLDKESQEITLCEVKIEKETIFLSKGCNKKCKALEAYKKRKSIQISPLPGGDDPSALACVKLGGEIISIKRKESPEKIGTLCKFSDKSYIIPYFLGP